MNNVVGFKGKHFRLSEHVENLKKEVEHLDVPQAFITAFEYINSPEVREILSEKAFEHIKLIHSEPNDVDVITLETQFRKNLVPEFGTQCCRGFLRFVWGYSNDIPEIGESVSPDPLQNLCDYFDSYPEMQSNYIILCYSSVKGLLANSNLIISFSGIPENESVYVLNTYDPEKSKDGYLFLGIVVDFLPILLDTSALKYWEEKLQGK